MKNLVGLVTVVLFLFASASAVACDDGGDGDKDYQPQEISTQIAPQGPTIACDGDGGDDDS